MKFLFAFVFLFMSMLNVTGQVVTVTGIVTDARDGEPLIGGVVTRIESDLVENQEYVFTDVDGKYSIEVKLGEKLRFFYVGYETVEKRVENKIVIDVKMKETGANITPSCFGIPAFSHSIMASATYSSDDKFGYGLDYRVQYSYFSPCNIKQKVINMFQFGVAFKDVDPSNSEYLFNPYVALSLPSSPSFRYKQNKIFVHPYLDTGYYIDTNFKKESKKGLSYGGGIQVLLKAVRIFGNRRNLSLTAGYSAYRHHSSSNHFYLGMRLNLTRNRVYILM